MLIISSLPSQSQELSLFDFSVDEEYVRAELGENAERYIWIIYDPDFQSRISPVLHDIREEAWITIMHDAFAEFIDLDSHKHSWDIDAWEEYAENLISWYAWVPTLRDILERNGYYPIRKV